MSSVRVHYEVTIKSVSNVNTTNPIRITWNRAKSAGKTKVVKMGKSSTTFSANTKMCQTKTRMQWLCSRMKC